MATLEDLTPNTIVISSDISSTPDLFKRIRQSFMFDMLDCANGVGCAMTYGNTILNNSYDNHLSLPF
ncbi:hypothetical protein TNCV_1798251 [Trichonephila clavipes]|uniref:Uncharacterized protein n=1 Tax=Trichonephila clavipes TaxID=2585209 RepID=A0A8X6SJ60_TRICX|nr:hypothetical protein TNCV_1798251 [Trichonephila clavipes]